MGGYNSGPYSYFGKTGKPTVSQCQSLDVRRLKREQLLKPGLGFKWHWTNNKGEETASIGVTIASQDTLKLNYTVKREGESTHMQPIINISFSDCHYGGQRAWFLCPACFDRVALLYLKGAHFKCRHCHNLTYQSCQESGNPTDERESRTNRILTKLKSKKVYGFELMNHKPHRPRGMHSTTYLRLLEEFEQEQMSFIVALSDKIGVFSKQKQARKMGTDG